MGSEILHLPESEREVLIANLLWYSHGMEFREILSVTEAFVPTFDRSCFVVNCFTVLLSSFMFTPYADEIIMRIVFGKGVAANRGLSGVF